MGALVLLLAAPSTGCANRPQGNTERFLEAVSRGSDLDLVRRLGTMTAAAEVIGHPLRRSHRDQDNLTLVDVAPSVPRDGVSEVPALVTRRGERKPRRLALRTELRDGVWRVVSAAPLRRRVRFPSEGGPIEGAPWRIVLFAGVVVALSVGGAALATVVAVRRAGGPGVPPEGTERKPLRG